jgi:SAM-dependent methyltransferase
MKRRLWNTEFSGGRWNCLEKSPDDCVYPFVEKYAKGGSILDLGCGSGNTGNELDATSYKHYTGIDISDVAIEAARKRSGETKRNEKNDYYQSDIVNYVPADRYEVILLRDSIYYLPGAQIVQVLNRYSSYLKEGGVFVVRMYNSSGKYKTIVDTIERHFCVLEKHFLDQSRALVLTFRPTQ